MGRPRDVATLLQEGLGPTQIAERQGISVGSVRGYLWVAAGEGLIRRSDVLFSLPKALRKAVERIVRAKHCPNIQSLQRCLYEEQMPYQREELEILWTLTVSRVGHGDLYEFVTST